MAASMEEVMQVKRLREEAVLPVRGSVHAAGFDLAAAEAAVLDSGRVVAATAATTLTTAATAIAPAVASRAAW